MMRFVHKAVLLLVLSLLLAYTAPAFAQTGNTSCTVKSQSQLLTEWETCSAQSLGAGCLSAALVRDLICSMSGIQGYQPFTGSSSVTCAQTGSSVPCVNQNNANILINPSMEIDQTNAGASQTLSAASVILHSIDAWNAEAQTAASVLSMQQCTAGTCTQAAAQGFVNYLRMKVGTGSATVNAGDFIKIWQPVEAGNTTNLSFGVTSAALLCMQWQSESSVANFVGNAVLQNAALTRSYIGSFTESATPNTWTYHTMCLTGDTTGTWVTSGTADGMNVGFSLESGSTFQTSNNNLRIWVAGNFLGPANSSAISKTTGGTWDVTGVKLEVIPNGWPLAPTAYQRNPSGYDLNNAQRYNYVVNEPAAGIVAGYCQANQTSTGVCAITFPTPMRAAPSCAITTGTFKVLILNAATTWVPTSPTTNTTPLSATIADTNTWAAAGQISQLEGGGGSGKIACSSQL